MISGSVSADNIGGPIQISLLAGSAAKAGLVFIFIYVGNLKHKFRVNKFISYTHIRWRAAGSNSDRKDKRLTSF